MIAQASQPDFWPTMEHIALLLAMAGNVALVVALKRKTETVRVAPQPFDVRMIETMAKEKDCLERHKDSLEQIAQMRKFREDDAKTSSISRKALYEEIRRTGQTSQDRMDDIRKELSDKINDMPDRIIATLRNVGAIGTPKTDL